MLALWWNYCLYNRVENFLTLSTVGPIRQVTWDYWIMNNACHHINYALPLCRYIYLWRKSDCSLWWIKEQHSPRQSEKLSRPEEAESDQRGEENLTPTGFQEQGVNLFLVKLKASVHADLSTSAHVFAFPADLNVAPSVILERCTCTAACSNPPVDS